MFPIILSHPDWRPVKQLLKIYNNIDLYFAFALIVESCGLGTATWDGQKLTSLNFKSDMFQI